MIKRTPHNIGTLILLAAMLILTVSTLPAWAGAVTIVSVQSGHSIVIDTDGLKRVAVGDSRIAGVVPIGTSQIVINGKTPGHTTVLVWTMDGHQTYEVTVTEQSVDDVARILRAAINQPDVQVLSFDNNLVLRGTVPDQSAFNQLQDLLGRFAGIKISGQDAKLVNAVTIAHPLGTIEEKAMQLPGASDVHLDPDGQGNVIVSGRVHDRADAQQVLERARGLAGAYLAATGKVIDRLTTETNSQIDVKVYILEVDKTFMNNLGIRLQGGQLTQTVTQAGGVATTVNYGSPSFIALEGGGNPPASALQVGKFLRTTLLAPTLDLLIQEGHGRILSSPDLVTLPGQEANFLVGGEIPIPFSSGLGQTTILYKTFGVQLDVTPTILGNGAIDTKITPEVSDLDFQDGVQLNGFTVPALKTSKVSTEVITQSGEAVVLGGLLRRVETRTIVKIPILGDLPILGKLFRSTDYQNNNTDVVFVLEPTVITR